MGRVRFWEPNQEERNLAKQRRDGGKGREEEFVFGCSEFPALRGQSKNKREARNTPPEKKTEMNVLHFLDETPRRGRHLDALHRGSDRSQPCGGFLFKVDR